MTSSWAIENNVPPNRRQRRRRESRSFSSPSHGTEAVDFPFGFAVAEEATVFLLVLRSLEIEAFLLGSIGMIV
ncbi:hypothetical protein F2Q69_00036930 [Brassica cretica]|uniref:Uncharacterized protein n=1 Tax=Brassica cretica TaxID=69181 RepID=A0A8S9SFF3_BRACR|nr:hypothetical protein F2Q69_00036930 [Brassica cretica]